jgi:chitin disaccharide deacetylase
MVRRQAADEAAGYARENPHLSVGLHVDMGEWVYRNGAWETVEEVQGPVQDEVRRQLDAFFALVGRMPTHIDSHQHIHKTEPAASVFASLASELNVPLRGLDSRVRYCGDFYGQMRTGEPLHGAIGVQALLDLLASLPEGVTELGCHPGVGTDDDLPYGSERSVEVQTLCDPRVRAALTANRIQLCSFADV